MDKLIITKVKEQKNPDINEIVSYEVTLANGVIAYVPPDPDNTDYAEIMRQVDAEELTIEPADE